MDKGLLTNPMKEGGSSSASTGGNKSLFDTFLDYFASSPEEEGDVPHGIIAGAKAKSLSLKTKIKQCLENMPFDYSPLFESATAPNSALTGFIQSMNVYELIRGTKYFEDAELDRLLDEVYIQICQGQIYAIFILLELVVTNKDRLEISWPVLEKLFNDSILKAKTEENTDPSVVYQKSQKKHVVSPVVELFAPITIYLFLLHSPRLCHHESLARMTGILINYVEQKFVSNYSANFCLMHLKALANFYRICASKLTDCGLFEAVLNFVDSSLDCISSSVDLAEEILGLGEVVVVLLSPALDSLSDTLNHHLITKIIEIIIKTIQILETKCEPGVDAVTPILMVLYNITQKNFKQDQDEGFKYIRQMVCLKGLQSVVISMKETKPKSALEALSVLNKTVIEMLHRPTITPKEVADIFKMILFPISEHYGKNFPSFTALPLALSEVMSKGFLLVLERISKTHDMPFIWMNTLKHLLLLIDKAHQVQAVEYIETMIERIKSIVMTMISMGLLSIVDGEEMEENTTQEKQLSVSSWKAIDAFLPDLKGEVAKILDAKQYPSNCVQSIHTEIILTMHNIKEYYKNYYKNRNEEATKGRQQLCTKNWYLPLFLAHKIVLVAAGGVLAGVLTTIGIQKLCCDDESPTKKKKEKNGDLHEEEKLPENPTTEPVPGYENNEDILTCPIGQSTFLLGTQQQQPQ
eukprot:TRINITY_DN921_c0_g1_i1.p1 TRINITY_DN921_c0_g1~~TRINITY_DN921_c0_g1_i1.p1  ORF type:complete len:694 (+),score=77.34 TRINITY_DN921_c0_g1_i1:2980-5061(+)